MTFRKEKGEIILEFSTMRNEYQDAGFLANTNAASNNHPSAYFSMHPESDSRLLAEEFI